MMLEILAWDSHKNVAGLNNFNMTSCIVFVACTMLKYSIKHDQHKLLMSSYIVLIKCHVHVLVNDVVQLQQELRFLCTFFY